MSESSGFFVSSGHDRIYTPDWLAEFIKALVTTGVYNDELGVTAGNDMSVSVAYGRAWVKGYLYLNDGPATFRIATADASLSRKDAVMLRLDRALRKIHLTIIQGDYAATPVAPGVTRNSDIYDLKLAEVSVPAGTTQITQSLIKDCRLDNAVCGITVSAVQYISTASYMSSMEAQFLAWFDTVKGIMGEDEAGNILNLLQSHIAESAGRSVAGKSVEPTQGKVVTAGEGAEIFNDYRERLYDNNGTPTQGNVASSADSHAEGSCTTASGTGSHAEGVNTTTSSPASHAEGYKTKVGIVPSGYSGAHAEGYATTANGAYGSHAEGNNTVADGVASHAEGSRTTAAGALSHAAGQGTVANMSQYVIGQYNIISGSPSGGNIYNTDYFIVGGGAGDSARKNLLRVHSNGVYGGPYNSSGADYAELFEWGDGNAKDENRAGLFVTLDGEKIRIAGPEDTDTLGIVSTAPSVVGDVYDDQWSGTYLRDVFGHGIYLEQDFPEETGPDGEVIREARTERVPALNPEYNSEIKYIPRSERPEWDAVGMMGKLVAVDDGTCEVNGYCTVGIGGVATKATHRTPYRVMKRLDENHVQVLIK